MILLCVKILSDTIFLMIQSNGIFSKKQGKKTSILGVFHGLIFFNHFKLLKQYSEPNVYSQIVQGNFTYNPEDWERYRSGVSSVSRLKNLVKYD